MAALLCMVAPGITRTPHCPASSARVDMVKAGKAQGPAWQGHTQRSQAARGRGTGQMVSTHSEKETLFYCLIWGRGEAPSPPCSSPVSPPATPSQVMKHLLFLCV